MGINSDKVQHLTAYTNLYRFSSYRFDLRNAILHNFISRSVQEQMQFLSIILAR